MKKSKIIFIIFGLLLCIIPFFINVYNVIRLISVIIGFILFCFGILKKDDNLLKLILLPIVSLSFIYMLDYFCVNIINTYPIVSYRVSSSKKMHVYNSIFYRVYDCNGIRSIDNGYKEDFMCNKDTLKLETVNAFLANPKESYRKYKNKFVHLEGKITKIVGTSELALNFYTDEESLNGYVNFDSDKSVVLSGLDVDPTNYYIYDNIEVVGMVTSYSEKNDAFVITLSNVAIINSGLYNDYTLTVNDIYDDTKVKKEEGIYYIGIEGIYYKYDENNIYSMDYLLKDKRVKVEDLTKDVEGIEVNDEDTLYELEDYNIVVCKNNDVIFVSKNIDYLDEVCLEEE